MRVGVSCSFLREHGVRRGGVPSTGGPILDLKKIMPPYHHTTWLQKYFALAPCLPADRLSPAVNDYSNAVHAYGLHTGCCLPRLCYRFGNVVTKVHHWRHRAEPCVTQVVWRYGGMKIQILILRPLKRVLAPARARFASITLAKSLITPSYST